MRLIEELDENVSVKWWKENRKKINLVIRKYNAWVKEGSNILQDIEKLKKNSSFSDWQFDIISEMEEVIKND